MKQSSNEKMSIAIPKKPLSDSHTKKYSSIRELAASKRIHADSGSNHNNMNATGTTGTTGSGSVKPIEHSSDHVNTSRAATIKTNALGALKLREMVQLAQGAVTKSYYRQQVAGINECLDYFPNGFPPAVAQESVGDLMAALNTSISTQDPGSELLIPGMISLINAAATPVLCVTLDDQRNLEGAMHALCNALSLPLSSPVQSLRIKAASALRRVFNHIRVHAGDDMRKRGVRARGATFIPNSTSISATMSKTTNVNNGAVPDEPTNTWKINMKRSITADVMRRLCDAWKSSIAGDVENIRAVSMVSDHAIIGEFLEGQGIHRSLAHINDIDSSDEEICVDSVTSTLRKDDRSQSKDLFSYAAAQDTTVGIDRDTSLSHDGMVSEANAGIDEREKSSMKETGADYGDAIMRDIECTAKRIAVARGSSIALSEMMAIMQALSEVTHFSKQARILVIDCGACSLGFQSLCICDKGDRRIPLIIEILWNLLVLCHDAAAIECSTVENIQTLYETFVNCLSLGFKQKETELRNDILIVISLIIHAKESLVLIGPFCELLFDMSCGNERRGKTCMTNPHINPMYHNTVSHGDQQAKILCWNFLSRLCCSDPALAESIIDWGFIDVLLSYIDIHCDIPCVVRWSTPQLLEIQKESLMVLAEITECGWKRFVQRGASMILQNYITECLDTNLRHLALTVMTRLVATDAKENVKAVGVIPMGLHLLANPDEDGISIECLNLLADVVSRDPIQQRLFLECDGVKVTLPFLTFAPKRYAPRMEEMIFSAVDCFWNCVVGRKENEDSFLANDGLHSLLCALETVSLDNVPFVLSAMADLLRNRDAVYLFRQWVSPVTNLSGTQLMIKLWRVADGSCDWLSTMSAAHKGLTLAESMRSDAMSNNNSYTLSRAHSLAMSCSIAQNGDSQGSLTAEVCHKDLYMKIYACMCCVGFADHRELTPKDRGTLAGIEVYEEMCNDLAWESVSKSLEDAGITLIPTDQRKLDRMLAESEMRKETLLTIQREYSQIEAQRQDAAEHYFYKSIIKKQEEGVSDTVRRNKGITITQAKIKKAKMLKTSFLRAQYLQNHDTADGTEANLTETVVAEPSQGVESIGNAENIVHSTKTVSMESKESVLDHHSDGQRAMLEEELEVLRLINIVRTNPRSFIPVLQEKLRYLNSDGTAFVLPGHPEEPCVEGALAVEEAIEALYNAPLISTQLEVPIGMLYATRDHITDLLCRADVGHKGSDGSTPFQRLARYGSVPQKSAHMQALGGTSAVDIVLQLLVDDGVSSRIDRRNILDPLMKCCSVSVGTHAVHGRVAVIALVYDYINKPRELQNDINRKVNSSKF